jgi:hypothetical protein
MNQEFEEAYEDLFTNAMRRLRKAWMAKLEAIKQCQETIKR